MFLKSFVWLKAQQNMVNWNDYQLHDFRCDFTYICHTVMYIDIEKIFINIFRVPTDIFLIIYQSDNLLINKHTGICEKSPSQFPKPKLRYLKLVVLGVGTSIQHLNIVILIPAISLGPGLTELLLLQSRIRCVITGLRWRSCSMLLYVQTRARHEC